MTPTLLPPRLGPPRVARWQNLACGLALATAAAAAQATVLQFSFEASITQDPFGLSQPGAPVSGHFSFESTAPDDIANPTQGSYTSTGAAYGFSVVVDGAAYATQGLLNIGTQTGSPGLYLVTGMANDLLLELVLSDDSGLAVSSDALPLAAPALDAFTVRDFRLFAPDAEFTAALLRLQGGAPASVPEPAPALLLLAGLAGVSGWLAARRRSGATFPNV